VDRELELNSLDRYVKSSPRYVLEEHSHCEVPAGCGGVVLRWRDRFTSIPVELAVAVAGEAEVEVRVDNEKPPSIRPLLPPGRHVLMVAVEPGSTMLAWVTSPDVEGPLLWTPGPAGAWRFTTDEPAPAAWTDPDLDVSSWPVAVPAAVPEETGTRYSVRRLTDKGAGAVAAPDAVPAVWYRGVFDVPAPE
jgi:hypothetical protein